MLKRWTVAGRCSSEWQDFQRGIWESCGFKHGTVEDWAMESIHLPVWPWELHYWLVVWNMAFIFPHIGKNHPNWLFFSEGLKPLSLTRPMWEELCCQSVRRLHHVWQPVHGKQRMFANRWRSTGYHRSAGWYGQRQKGFHIRVIVGKQMP